MSVKLWLELKLLIVKGYAQICGGKSRKNQNAFYAYHLPILKV